MFEFAITDGPSGIFPIAHVNATLCTSNLPRLPPIFLQYFVVLSALGRFFGENYWFHESFWWLFCKKSSNIGRSTIRLKAYFESFFLYNMTWIKYTTQCLKYADHITFFWRCNTLYNIQNKQSEIYIWIQFTFNIKLKSQVAFALQSNWNFRYLLWESLKIVCVCAPVSLRIRHDYYFKIETLSQCTF